jgi:hypothetical protein
MPGNLNEAIGGLITELPALVFSTRDPVINYLAPTALEKLVRLRTMLHQGRIAEARDLNERELGPTLEKLEDTLGELVERRVAPFEGWPTVTKVMELCREFQELHQSELQRTISDRQG